MPLGELVLPGVEDPGTVHRHAQLIAGMIRTIRGAAMQHAVVVHPQRAALEVETSRADRGPVVRPAAEQLVQLRRQLLVAHVLGARDHLEAAVLLARFDQRELHADLVGRDANSGKWRAHAVAVPALVVGARQRDVAVEVGPDVVLAQNGFQKRDQSRVLEDLRVHERPEERHAHVVPSPSAPRFGALALDVGIADRRPRLLDAVERGLPDQAVEDHETVDAKLSDQAVDVVAGDDAHPVLLYLRSWNNGS